MTLLPGPSTPLPDTAPGHSPADTLALLGSALHELSVHPDPGAFLTALVAGAAQLAGAEVAYLLETFATRRVLLAAFPSMPQAEAYLGHAPVMHLSDAVLFSGQSFIVSACPPGGARTAEPAPLTVASFALAWEAHPDTTLNLIFTAAPPTAAVLTALQVLIEQARTLLERNAQLAQARHLLSSGAQLAQHARRDTTGEDMAESIVRLLDAVVQTAHAQAVLLHLARGREQYVFAQGRSWDGQDVAADRVPLLSLLDVQALRAGNLIQLSASPARMGQFKSLLILPLKSGAQVAGMLTLCYSQPHPASEIEQQTLTIFANHALTLIERTRYVRATQQRLFELETLNRISRVLQGARSMERVLALLLDETLAAFHTDAGMICLYDAASGTFTREVARGWMGASEILQTAGQGISVRVLETASPYIVRDFRTDPVARAITRRSAPAGWGGISVPLWNGSRSVGVLHVSVPSAREIEPENVQLIMTIAEIAAGAIQRMQADDTLKRAYVQTTLALTRALDARDSDTGAHSADLAELAVALARELGLDDAEFESLRTASLLHDIGKLAIPDAILSKPGELTAQEWTLMRRHPAIGAEIIEPIQPFAQLALYVRAHHERYDGSGYPEGLERENIPLGARILAVVDSYCAMTRGRVYRAALSQTRALEELEQGAGTQFDPQVVSAFFRVVNALEHEPVTGAPDR